MASNQHFIPAAFLGRFSAETTFPVRTRRIYQLRRGWRDARTARGQDIGHGPNFYEIDHGNGATFDVDWVWTRYESRLVPALDQMQRWETPSLDTWLRVLVPFVAGLLVRGPSFGRRFRSRVGPLDEYPDLAVSVENSTNMARLFEMERLLAPLVCSRWVVMHLADLKGAVTSELGYAGTFNPEKQEVGLAVPLDPMTVLAIYPQPSGPVAHWTGEWEPVIEHAYLSPPADVGQLRETMAAYADEFLVGRSADALEGLGPALASHVHHEGEMEGIFFTSRAHRFEWHRLLGAVRFAPEELRADHRLLAVVDWGAVVDSDGWIGPPIMGGEEDHATGLRLAGNVIRLRLQLPPSGFDPDGPGGPIIQA